MNDVYKRLRRTELSEVSDATPIEVDIIFNLRARLGQIDTRETDDGPDQAELARIREVEGWLDFFTG